MEYKEQLKQYVKSNKMLVSFSKKNVKAIQADIRFKEQELKYLKTSLMHAAQRVTDFNQVILQTKKQIEKL